MEKSEYFLTNKGQKKACFDKNQKTCLRESIVFEYSSMWIDQCNQKQILGFRSIKIGAKLNHFVMITLYYK